MNKKHHIRRTRLLNYGWILKHHKGYRNALRQCKKNLKCYGAAFDDSEVTSLDEAMCMFMYKNSFPINKNILCFCVKKSINQELFEIYQKLKKIEAGQPSFDVFLDIEADLCQQITELDNFYKQRLVNFLLPRMQCFVDNNILYPAWRDIETAEEWNDVIRKMMEEIKGLNFKLLLDYRKELFTCSWRN